MYVFMIGGTGLIGSTTAELLIKKGHQVKSIVLPELPQGAVFPSEMELIIGNYMEMTDEEILKHMAGSQGFIFAAGIDERVKGSPPIYDLFKRYNIDPLKRLLSLAKQSGIKHCVICGSYFSHFARKWPNLQFGKHHPYIKSRLDQAKMALEFASDDFHVAIIELPYIFGIQPGRKPVWVFFAEIIQGMKKRTYFPKGGTTMITVGQAAQALVGALEKNVGGNNYPLGYYNMEWKEFLTIVHEGMGLPSNRRIVTIPNFVFSLFARRIKRKERRANIESGLNLRKITSLQTAKLFISANESAKFLGVEDDDIEQAIKDSLKLSVEILNNNEINFVDMKI